MKKMMIFLWQTKRANTKWHAAAFNNLIKFQGLAFFCISYDGFMTAKGKKAVWRFLKRRKVFMTLDESDDIRTPSAKRTRSVVASGAYPAYKRILTGTPADKPFDIYSQLRFLDEGIWRRLGMENFRSFKQHYAEWFTAADCEALHGYDPGYDKLLRYKNIDELAEILASVSDRLLKTDVLDLPDKLYTKRWFDMTPKQQAYYDKMRDEFEIELQDGRIVDGNLALTRLLRLQQITCGYMVTDAEEPVELCDVKNPRLDCSLAFLEKLNHPAIVWSRFTRDIDQIMDALGPRAVRYDGTLDDDECERSKLAFNAGDADWFVGNPSKGSRGITINAAKTTMYYSNSFKYRDRMQSEDRNHRIGQDGVDHGEYGFGVLYADVLAHDTVDMHIVENLRGKYDIASRLTGDMLREWI
jgi:SNF2 family DNA or RNA helicase